ncbi:hypothetical protein HGRIS_009221 [Hohenbuehelia grisea]|uniref:Uncharacterized protein n=1 Tax=Hohenbuehelia grisea TaxID=104357 RepID=A0ABR3J0Z3_9AGAR
MSPWSRFWHHGFITKENPRRPQSVCRYCWQKLFGPSTWFEKALHERQLPAKYKYTRWRNKLHSSAETGCRWCATVLEEASGYESITVKVTLELSWDNDSPIQNLNVRCPRKGSDEVGTDYYIYAEPSNPAALLLEA